MKKQDYPDFQVWTLNEDMSTEEIMDAWDDIGLGIQTLIEACDNRLDALGYDEDEYDDDNPNDEIESLLELRYTLDSINV